MKTRLFLFTIVSYASFCVPQEEEQKPASRSLKDKYHIAKIILSNGTSGITDAVKDKLQQSALIAKDAIAASVEQTQIAIERARAEYAEKQVDELKKELAAVKKELQDTQKILDHIRGA